MEQLALTAEPAPTMGLGPDAPPAKAAPPPADPNADLKERLRAMDLESLGTLLGESMLVALKLQQELEPHMVTAAAARAVIFEKLESEQRERLNHKFLDIFIKTESENVVYEDELRALLDPNLRVDGEPIPADVLGKAVWIEEIPAQQVLKKHLTHIKSLVKKYGSPEVKAIVQKAVVPVDKRKLVVTFKDK